MTAVVAATIVAVAVVTVTWTAVAGAAWTARVTAAVVEAAPRATAETGTTAPHAETAAVAGAPSEVAVGGLPDARPTDRPPETRRERGRNGGHPLKTTKNPPSRNKPEVGGPLKITKIMIRKVTVGVMLTKPKEMDGKNPPKGEMVAVPQFTMRRITEEGGESPLTLNQMTAGVVMTRVAQSQLPHLWGHRKGRLNNLKILRIKGGKSLRPH